MLGGVFLARAEGVESQAYVIQSQAAQAVAASNLDITTVRKLLQGIKFYKYIYLCAHVCHQPCRRRIWIQEREK